MDRIYICDIDGTVAHNNGHRSPYDESKVFDDTPLPTVEVIKSLIATGERIIYFSGRKQRSRQDTINWLTKFIDDEHPELYMRGNLDNRPDDILKAEMFDKYILNKYEVIGIFDDRIKVCEMWWRRGLFVFCCNQGLKEF